MTFTRFTRFAALCFLLTFSMVGLSACDALTDQLKADRSGGLEKQDYRDALAERDIDLQFESDKEASRNKIPALNPYISQSSTQQKAMPLVSVSVNRSVPLRDIFYQLAEQSNMDIELDPRIRGSIIFTARQRPLDQVVERICDMAGLRYSIVDNVMRIERDTPYNQTYKIDYLSYIRSNSSSISTNVSVVSGDGADTGSAFSSSSESESDFWGNLEQSLESLLANSSTQELRTSDNPEVRVVAQNVDVRAVSAPDANGNIQVSPPNATLRVSSLEEEDEIEQPESQFVINKQAGLINVFGTQAVQKEIADYMFKLKRSVTAQVLIEAKILEVTLADSYSSGIDWRAVNLFSDEFVLNYVTGTGNTLLDTVEAGLGSTLDDSPPRSSTASSSFVTGFVGNDIQALVRAISEYGTTKALASPRLTVINNQAAVLNVSTNRVFFEIDIDVTTDEGETQTEIESEVRNIPEGVLVNVLPSIDLENQTVSMAVRPTITRVVREIADPGVAFVVATSPIPITGVENLVPEVNVQEIDTVVRMRSGQAIVMGGLLQDNTTSVEDGIPVLSDLPGFAGNLFKTHADTISKTELVIFLKATILDDPSDTIHDTDRDLYRKFSEDRRPFKI